jgi:hypothetical protein
LANSLSPALASTIRPVKQIWTGRMAQAAGKYGEHAPMATVCCNACRTCTTTNLISLGIAGVSGAAIGVANLARRRFAKPS